MSPNHTNSENLHQFETNLEDLRQFNGQLFCTINLIQPYFVKSKSFWSLKYFRED